MSQPHEPEHRPETKRALVYFFGALCLIGLVLWGLHALFGRQLEEATLSHIRDGGLLTYFVAITSINVFIVPMSADVLIAFAPSIFDKDEGLALLLTATSPLVAAGIDLGLGRRYGKSLLLRISSEKVLKKSEELVQRYGVLAIALTAITPLPFSAVCWVCGILRINALHAMITVLLTRVPRHILVYYFADAIIEHL